MLSLLTVPLLLLAKPRILLVHGAFADGSCWVPVVRILQRDGYSVEAVQNDMHSLSADIANVRARIAAQSGPTLVVGHSYGGEVISGAATGAPNAVGLVYLTALVIDKGESFASIAASAPPSEGAQAIAPDAAGNLYFNRDKYADLFANGLASEEAKALAATQRPLAGAAFGEALADEGAWKSLPVWYGVTLLDKVIPPDAQRLFAQRAKAKVVEINAGHAAMLAKPDEVAKLIETAAQAVAK